ncbi:transcription factor HES-5-like [Protopterus annectens]|uniref:transcription factor HES-5-like n=1 Tax=Protopterus annectens TaxID=7888 RepID=UPI001CF9F30B|nr:transcription factor HES-5-like [Protopterus annectens]
MASNNLCVVYTGDPNSSKENNKLRKLTVEKMRRDRINNSIEQLKQLLEKNFKKQQLNSKLEKADILEMTVNFLRQHRQGRSKRSLHNSSNQDFREGYSRCLQETIAFVSFLKPSTEAKNQVLNHFQQGQEADVPVPSLSSPLNQHHLTQDSVSPPQTISYQGHLNQDPASIPPSTSGQHLYEQETLASIKALWRPW